MYCSYLLTWKITLCSSVAQVFIYVLSLLIDLFAITFVVKKEEAFNRTPPEFFKHRSQFAGGRLQVGTG